MKPLIILAGPTAVGKTDLSIQLAKQINGADHFCRLHAGIQIHGHWICQRLCQQEMQGIDHYLIDELLPDPMNLTCGPFSDRWQRNALQKIYAKKDKFQSWSGGTGFYIQATVI